MLHTRIHRRLSLLGLLALLSLPTLVQGQSVLTRATAPSESGALSPAIRAYAGDLLQMSDIEGTRRPALDGHSAVAEASGRYLLVFSAHTDTPGEVEIFGRFVDASGTVLSDDIEISQMGRAGDVSRDGYHHRSCLTPVAQNTWSSGKVMMMSTMKLRSMLSASVPRVHSLGPARDQSDGARGRCLVCGSAGFGRLSGRSRSLPGCVVG